MSFSSLGSEGKSRKSTDTQNNSQVWSWSTKWSRAKANSFVKRTLWSQQPPFSNPTDVSSHGHHQTVNNENRLIMFSLQPKMEKLYTVSENKTWSWLWLRSNFRLKMKKVGKTTRSFKYDLNQIPYNDTMKVMNRLKGLDLTDRGLKNHGRRFVTLHRKQWSKPSPRKRNAKRQNGCLWRPYK